MSAVLAVWANLCFAFLFRPRTLLFIFHFLLVAFSLVFVHYSLMR